MSHSALQFIRPLDEFYARQNRPLPAFAILAPDEVPEPDHSLLVHERDMTRTLENFHSGRIHLRVLSRYHTADAYWRESVLELDETERSVEFGAIKIYLNRFPEPWRKQILEERRPLGGILNESGIAYTSSPTAYLRFAADDFIERSLKLAKSQPLYGRQNTLRNAEGAILAEIVEILPPSQSPT